MKMLPAITSPSIEKQNSAGREEAVEPAGAVQDARRRRVDLVVDVVFGQLVAHVADREDVDAAWRSASPS